MIQKGRGCHRRLKTSSATRRYDPPKQIPNLDYDHCICELCSFALEDLNCASCPVGLQRARDKANILPPEFHAHNGLVPGYELQQTRKLLGYLMETMALFYNTLFLQSASI